MANEQRARQWLFENTSDWDEACVASLAKLLDEAEDRGLADGKGYLPETDA